MPPVLHLWEPDSCTHIRLLLNFHVAYSTPIFPTPFSYACLSRSFFPPTPVSPTAIFLLPVTSSHDHFFPLLGSFQSLPFLISHLPFSHIFAPCSCLAAYAALSREKVAPDEEARSPGCSLIQEGGFPAIPTSPQLHLPTGFWRSYMFLTLLRGSLPLPHCPVC